MYAVDRAKESYKTWPIESLACLDDLRWQWFSGKIHPGSRAGHESSAEREQNEGPQPQMPSCVMIANKKLCWFPNESL